MIENLTQTQGKLYTRAVDPAVESRLRTRDSHEKPSPASDNVHNRQSRIQHGRHRQADYEQSIRDQLQQEQRSKDMAEELSQALQKARQMPAKYKSAFTLATHTGRRANQSYLNAGQSKELRMVDELA